MADVQIGYAISSEEHLPNDIVQHAGRRRRPVLATR